MKKFYVYLSEHFVGGMGDPFKIKKEYEKEVRGQLVHFEDMSD